MTAFLPIVTERLLLRDFTVEDAPAVHRYGSNPEVVRYMPWGPNTWKDTEDFLKLKLEDQRTDPRRRFDLAVTLASSGELIGACGLYVISTERRQGAIGYVYRRDVWGRGYATEAARALVALGFEKLGMHRIFSYVDVDNAASARVLEKAGMQREGLVRHDVQMRGEWRDSYLYAILEDDPPAGQ